MTKQELDDWIRWYSASLHPHSGAVDWVREQLARFTYKEGWTFSVVPNVLHGPMVYIGFMCKDTYNPDGPEVGVGKGIPLLMVPTLDKEPFAGWLAHQVQSMEIHESREWLRRDGVIFDDPHKHEKI